MAGGKQRLTCETENMIVTAVVCETICGRIPMDWAMPGTSGRGT